MKLRFKRSIIFRYTQPTFFVLLLVAGGIMNNLKESSKMEVAVADIKLPDLRTDLLPKKEVNERQASLSLKNFEIYSLKKSKVKGFFGSPRPMEHLSLACDFYIGGK